MKGLISRIDKEFLQANRKKKTRWVVVISILRKQRLISEFQASLVDRASSRAARDKQKNKTKQEAEALTKCN